MRLLQWAAIALVLFSGAAHATTEIDLYFPVPVQGKLAAEMQRLVTRFNHEHPDITATAVYTGSYDDTNLKTRAAIEAGRPPAAVIMSANFVREYVINNEAIALDDLIAKDGQTPAQFMAEFWPALQPNAMDHGRVYGVPFQNSTPILYYNTAIFREVGLNPDHPPTTWAEFVDAARKIARTGGGSTSRWGVMMPGTYDYCGWITSGLAMSNGGQFYNPDYGGEVYYTQPSTIGAVQFLDDLVHTFKVMPEGITDANAVTTAFFQGRTGMMILSTGSLSFVRDNMKQPYRTTFMPRNLVNAAPIGGASLIIPRGNSPERVAAAWTLIKWLTSPEIAGGWSRFTGYFAPRIAAYDLPEMKSYLAEHPDAKVALDQLAYARGWFATYNTVGVRKALEDGVQAVLSGKAKPREAMEAAQHNADELMRPYVEQTALKLPQ
ncbi:MAG: ABC transporter substrate-binding protein [Acetobacteraceae bacterium]|nr:ABC transporter substrate-binding protein [Acetobacteraceae bacterium]